MIRDMNPSERRAYDLGVHAAIDAARIGAITIGTAPDASTFRKTIAAAALAAFADAAEGLKLAKAKPNPVIETMEAIASDPATSGVVACPTCAGRMQWAKDSSNGHIHAQCETPDCLRIMQ